MVTGNLRLRDPFFQGRAQHGKAFEGLPPLRLREGCERYHLFCHDECDILASKGPTPPSLSSIPVTSANRKEITSLNSGIYNSLRKGDKVGTNSLIVATQRRGTCDSKPISEV